MLRRIALDGYVRVSQVAGRGGPGFISPEVQRDQIEGWLSGRGRSLGIMFEELDQSGARADRPLLMQAIERIEAGESQGVVVAKLDRFGRSLIDGLAALARIEDAGGQFVSVQDGFDLASPTGKLILRIMFAMGEWELDRIRDNWTIARGKATARGIHGGNRAPFGYLRREEDHLLVPDPQWAPIVTEIFVRRAGGASAYDLLDFLEEAGYRTGVDTAPSTNFVYKLTRNRVYLGEARSGEFVNKEAHPALVDPATWQRAQVFRPRPHHRIHSLLADVIRCASCGRPMGAVRDLRHGKRAKAYRCSGMSRGRGNHCRAPASASLEEIDPLIEGLVFELAQRSRPSTSESSLAADEQKAEDALTALERYRDNSRVLEMLGAEMFEAGVLKRHRRYERSLLKVAASRRGSKSPKRSPEALDRLWATLPMSERRGWIGEYIDCVAIERGSGPPFERSWAYLRGSGPLKVGRGAETHQLRPASEGARQLSTMRRWSEEAIASRLRSFLGDRTDWPPFRDFQSAGEGPLHWQVMNWGGPLYWAHKLGLSDEGIRITWNTHRLRGALAPILKGRETWPTRVDFRRAGVERLYQAFESHGGQAHWARACGLRWVPMRRVWTNEEVQEELDLFLADHELFPAKMQFRAANRGALYQALLTHGGLDYWAKRMGKKRAPRWNQRAWDRDHGQ